MSFQGQIFSKHLLQTYFGNKGVTHKTAIVRGGVNLAPVINHAVVYVFTRLLGDKMKERLKTERMLWTNQVCHGV